MFFMLLLVTFVVALIVSTVIAILFDHPVSSILRRIVAEELSAAWHRYLKFAIYVVGVSGGVRIWELEKYITPRTKEEPAIVLTSERWTLEVYRTIIETAQSVAWMLLVFFLIALLAYVIVRVFEIRRAGQPTRA